MPFPESGVPESGVPDSGVRGGGVRDNGGGAFTVVPNGETVPDGAVVVGGADADGDPAAADRAGDGGRAAPSNAAVGDFWSDNPAKNVLADPAPAEVAPFC